MAYLKNDRYLACLVTFGLCTLLPTADVEAASVFKEYITAAYSIELMIGILIVFSGFLIVTIRKNRAVENNLKSTNKEMNELRAQLSAADEKLQSQCLALALQQENLRASEERYRLLAEGSNDGLWDWDIEKNTRILSSGGLQILGCDGTEIEFGLEAWQKLIHPEDIDYVMEMLQNYLTGKTPVCCLEYRIKMKTGDYKWIRDSGKAAFNQDGKPVRMAGWHTDITELRAQEQKIERMAYYDSLTNLPNRKLLAERFNQQLIEAGTENAISAILIIDIDNFKRINDTIGYTFGDRLLVEIGNKFIALAGQQHIVAKLGGDEFIVLLTEVGGRSLAREHAEKIMQLFESPFVINNNSFHISASIGIALCPDDGTDVDELLKNADTAMNKVKESGKRSYRFFESTMNDAVVEKINLDRYLRAAIANHEFILYYQPQINILTGKMTGFEALIRWLSPEYGMISPLKFISLAEESGLILPIGEWVLRTACLFNKNLQDKGCGTFYVSVNISVVQLIQDNFINMVVDILQETGLSPTFLELEITETVLMDSFESNVQKLETLKAMGIKISLDDFGKGYSSLNYLKQLPITTLKIDKSFIDDITSDNVNAAITSSIIMLAHEMGLKVIAEGVETQEQFNHLNVNNCDMIQGYLISKPIPGEEIDRLFNQ
ncbi:MAG TPA: EAL domain-containing protein [Negativicutes bacterium]